MDYLGRPNLGPTLGSNPESVDSPMLCQLGVTLPKTDMEPEKGQLKRSVVYGEPLCSNNFPRGP